MNFTKAFASSTVLAVALSGGVAFAQYHDDHHEDHHDDHHYVRHTEWRRGYHMNHDDWNRGERVDWRAHHLAQPRPGYEWREVDGNYVMAAVATGIIASTIIAAGH